MRVFCKFEQRHLDRCPCAALGAGRSTYVMGARKESSFSYWKLEETEVSRSKFMGKAMEKNIGNEFHVDMNYDTLTFKNPPKWSSTL